MVVHNHINGVNIIISEPGKEEKSSNDVNSYLLDYYGALFIDRRYSPVVFSWLANQLIKKDLVQNVDAKISSTSIKIFDLLTEQSICKSSLDSIYRLSHLKNCNLDQYFAYVTLGSNELMPCKFHLFSCPDPQKQNDFLKTLKTNVLEFQKKVNSSSENNGVNFAPPKPTHRRGVSSGAILVSPVTSDAVFRDSVYYIGKVTISKPQAPPKFIDEVLFKFQRIHVPDHVVVKGRRASSVNIGKQKTFSFDEILSHGPRANKNNSHSDSSDTENGPIQFRKRSSSLSHTDDPKKESSNSLQVPGEAANDNDITLNNINQEVHSRLVTLQISKTSLMLFSVGSKTLLLEKKINTVSFCTKGENRNDHFGFICREGNTHICYVFQGECEQKVDMIMKAMKLAFEEALEASAHLRLCECCPLQYLHKICNQLEAANSLHEKTVVLENSMKYFTEYEQLHIMNKVNDVASGDDILKNEVTVQSMREILDQKQKDHKHTNKLQSFISDIDSRERSKSNIFEKAKKSFATSLHTLAHKKGQPLHKTTESISQNIRESFTRPRSHSFNSVSSSCPPTPDFTASKKVSTASETSNKEEKARRSRSNSTESKEDLEAKSIETKENLAEIPKVSKKSNFSRKTSWRQAIYNSVIVPSRKSSNSSIITLSTVEGDGAQQILDPSKRARERWKNAIKSQIVLIRMEKENKKLAAKISATETRRQKLSYEELGSYTADAALSWDEMLKSTNERIESHILLEAVRGGIPKARRGEIWQLLMKQSSIRNPVQNCRVNWKEKSYRSLVRQNTQHQHAILIDLGRTFPTHAHFIPRLGSGQIALYNILKSYSLLDQEVGYCQGLSFVAGILLMHMSEEDTFKSFCYMLFDLDIRNQYKPDMNAVQQQMYQLSRLLHDYHPDLYEHFNTNDVTPTLYAAPWFLTLFASQYPIGFVTRVMDLVFLEGLEVIFKVALVLIGNHVEEILQCDSFETIVEYMKSSLPDKVTTETDEICKRALDMDLKQKLNLYEVEYQLLNEEMIDTRFNKEKFEKQEIEQKKLEQQVAQLNKELMVAKNMINTLKEEVNLANKEKKTYQNQIRALCDKKEFNGINLIDGLNEDGHLNGVESKTDSLLISFSNDSNGTLRDSINIGSDLSIDSLSNGEDKILLGTKERNDLLSFPSVENSEILIFKKEKT